MRHQKLLRLLVGAATCLMVFAGPAAADQFTSPAGTTYTGAFGGAAEGHTVIDNPIATIQCASSWEGTVQSHGVGNFVGISLSSLSFTGCTNDWHVTVGATGVFSVDGFGTSGEVISSGATIETTRFGVNCRYATVSTRVGTITGGGPATIHISSSLPFHGGSFLCGSGGTRWTGAYKVTSPGSLFIDNT